MLPDGFEWRPYVDGPALYLGDRMLAVHSSLPDGCRIDFVLHRHSKFFSSQDQAQRYCEAWAVKWESRIRNEAGRQIVSGWDDVRKP